MIKYLLVEDERFAYEEMKRMMEKLRPEYQLEAWVTTVEQTVQFLKHHQVDLMLLDIRLTDGNSFDIFEQIQVTTPVIFTTAYDEHAIRAFKVNSVDYLLKPVEEADLQAALSKFEQLRMVQFRMEAPSLPDYKQLESALMSNCKKNRFLIQKGDAYHYVETADIAFSIVKIRWCFCILSPINATLWTIRWSRWSNCWMKGLSSVFPEIV